MRITTDWIRFFFIKKKECKTDEFKKYDTMDGQEVWIGFIGKKIQSISIQKRYDEK